MSIRRLTERVARIEAEDKRLRRININPLDGFFDGRHAERQGPRTYTPERISDGELSFLSDIRHLGLTGKDSIAEAASRHRIDDKRLSEMRGRYFVDLTEEERDALELLKEYPFRTPGSLVEASLEEKGFIHGLLPRERAFLSDLASLEQPSEDKLALFRAKHGISAEMQDAFQKAGVLDLPDGNDIQWLKAFKAGAGIRELKDLADQLRVRSWTLRGRIETGEDGIRKINLSPIVMQGDLLIFDGPKVRWRREKPEELSRRQLSPLLPERKDLRLISSLAEPSGTWQAIRQKRLMDHRAMGRDNFDAHVWSFLSPMEKAAILALDEADLTKSQAAFRVDLGGFFDDGFKERMREERISNDEYFFLAALRREPEKMDMLASAFRVDPSRLKDGGYIDFLEESEREILLPMMNKKAPDQGSQGVLDDLLRRGFIHLPEPDERRFLAFVRSAAPSDKETLLKAGELFLFDERKIVGLKARGFLSYLEDNEKAFLLALASDPNESFEDLAMRHDVHYPERLRKERLTGSGVDMGIRVDELTKFRLNPRVQYREERGLLKDRIGRPMSHVPSLVPEDTALFLSDLAGEPLSLRQVERLTELKAGGKSLGDALIPDNSELAFLRKIAWRKEDTASLLKIAGTDFGLSDASVRRLVDQGFIRSKGKKYLPYREPAMLQKARVWLNTSQAMRKNLKLEEPHPELIKVMKGRIKRLDVGEKLMDYEIYFKVLRGEKVSRKESERLGFMRENGLHPESREFSSWVRRDPKSWRMKDTRREAYLQHYEKAHGVNLQVLGFINTFKQATDEQIIRQGLSRQELQRYASGLDSAGRHRLLNEHVLLEKGGRPIKYYSISHIGPISGRKFLEHRLKVGKAEIPEKPQQRRDLLYHDLKVVGCVQEVIEMKKAEGKEAVKLLNEAMQFAMAKGGLQNHQRQAGPSFMDAEIIFREEAAPGQSSGSGSEVVAVEYGNYTLDRMREKLENCSFDHAYVFAKPDYVAKYAAHITVPNVTYIPMR